MLPYVAKKKKSIFADVINNIQGEDPRLYGTGPKCRHRCSFGRQRRSQTGKRRKWCEWRRDSLNDAKLLALKMEDEDVNKQKQEMQP